MIKERISRILTAEAEAIKGVPINENVVRAVEMIVKCRGKVFTTGIGKAGYVAQKAASTFSTTGTPAVFLHPGDAPHGDIGVVTPGDILIAYSNSGKTREVLEVIGFAKHLGADAVISITSHPDTPLGAESDLVLSIGDIKEPCPLGMTPSASTSAMIALSDALALVAMEERGFTKEDFAQRHHGGYLGKKSRGELL
ncbi:SIS domain-containing protein [bacterium]|nr:SIS domain-containing protein [bacterium]